MDINDHLRLYIGDLVFQLVSQRARIEELEATAARPLVPENIPVDPQL